MGNDGFKMYMPKKASVLSASFIIFIPIKEEEEDTTMMRANSRRPRCRRRRRRLSREDSMLISIALVLLSSLCNIVLREEVSRIFCAT